MKTFFILPITVINIHTCIKIMDHEFTCRHFGVQTSGLNGSALSIAMNHGDIQSERLPPPHRSIALSHVSHCFSLTLQNTLYCSPEYFWTVWLSLTLSTCHFVIMFWKLLFHFRFNSLWFYLKILCKTLVSTGYFRTYRNNYLHRKQRWSLYLMKKKACCNKAIHILRFQ